MTADRRAALVEKVARETCDAVNGAGAYDETMDIHQDAVWRPIATAAIALIRAEVLEEAARELDRWGDIYGDNAAAAIRALKEKA